ncbi:MAG TPA: hypothetical protein VJM75_11000, partial [Acidimicrobiales bacterium]|nr:hypothetical protein [Acidimicrobiales bacterium]
MTVRDYGFRVIPFVTNTATGIQTITIPSGLGSDKTPKAVEIYLSGATALDTRTATARMSIGISDGTNHRCLAGMCEDNVNASVGDTGFRMSTTALLEIVATAAQGLVATANFDSFDVGEVNIDWVSAPDAAYRCFAIIWYGTDLSAHVSSGFGSSTLDGTVTSTAVGFQSTLIKGYSAGQSDFATGNGGEMMLSLGACDADLNQASVTVVAEDRQSTTSVGVLGTAEGLGGGEGRLVAGLTSTGGTIGQGAGIEVTAISSNGWTLTTRDLGASLALMILSIRVPDVRTHVGGVPVDASATGSFDEAFPFLPRAAGFLSIRAAQQNVIGSGQGNISVGATDGTNQAVIGFNDRDNVSTTEADSVASNSLVVLVTNASDTDWAAEFDNFSNDPADRGAILTITDAAGADRFMIHWGIEDQLVLSPTGIAHTNAFGTAVLTLAVTPAGIAHTNAFGTAVVSAGSAQDLTPTGLAHTNAFGTAVLTLAITPAGIAHTNAFGTAVVAPGAVDVTPAGIAHTNAFGSATILQGIFILPAGIAHTNAFGTAAVAPGAVDIAPAGIAHTNAFGAATLTL